ncbi:MAG: DUF3536 domain-containing protein [Candidatus Margulisiibacteriota bacterium]
MASAEMAGLIRRGAQVWSQAGLHRAVGDVRKASASKHFAQGWVGFLLHLYAPMRILVESRQPHTLSACPMPEIDAGEGYVNWTARVVAECYYPLLTATGVLARTTWNMGPTLVEQLKSFCPDMDIAGLLRTASDESIKLFGESGAFGQSMFHTVLTLDGDLDKRVQIGWGARYYEVLYGRKPKALWLPEGAVDLATLSCLQSFGMQYVVLSPHSAKRFRIGDEWVDNVTRGDGLALDHGQPYFVQVGGSPFQIFFYDGKLSNQFGFDDLLGRGKDTEKSEIDISAAARRVGDQIGHRLYFHGNCMVANDGEIFGHHRPDGLAIFQEYLQGAESRKQRITNYSQLAAEAEKDPSQMREVELYFPSSWSCAHGDGRWSSNCGCEGDNPWREGLRSSLRYLAGEFDQIFDRETSRSLSDPEGARIRYIDVLLGQQTFDDFIAAEKKPNIVISNARRQKLSVLFNALVPRYAMFTSCGWFFHGFRLEIDINLGFAWELLTHMRLVTDVQDVREKFLLALAGTPNSPDLIASNQAPNAAVVFGRVIANQRSWLDRILAASKAT